MADEQKFTPEAEKAISEATTSEEIRDIALAQPRDDKGKFVAKDAATATTTTAATTTEAAKVEEPIVVKDTFLIGGKPVEFTGDSAEDLLKQVKVAQQAYEMGHKKEEPAKVDTAAADKIKQDELNSLRLKALTDPDAMIQYIEKSGSMDRYLESKGIKPAEIKEVLESNASQKVVTAWDGAVREFLADSDWPGGTQNEKLLKYKLAELKGDDGQPLAYAPSKASLQRAYESLKEEGMLFAREEVKTEEAKTEVKTEARTASATTTTTVAKKAATGSTVFGTSQESGTRRTAATTKTVPQIADTDDPATIMSKFKDAAIAAGQSPDDVLRGAYSGKA